MSCEIIKTNIPSLLAGELPEDDRQRMHRHMEECSLCHAEMAELEKTWKQMDRWEIKEPSAAIKARVMAVAKTELTRAHMPWWSTFPRFVIFQTVLGALGFSMIIYLIFPYDKIINLCETLILNSTFFSYFPKGLIYFALGLLYGLVPISISGICFSKHREKNPLIKGPGAGSIFAGFLIPFFIIKCPEFASGLIFIMALGMFVGSLSGATGIFWVLRKLRMEAT